MSKRLLKSPIWILLFSIAIFGCNDKVKRPDNIIEKDEFAAILADIHLVEANYLQGKDIPDSLRTDYLEHYNMVFNIHDIDQVTFFTNFEYYTAHPKLLEKIYEQVHTRLQIQQDQLIHHHETGKIDSTGTTE